MAAKLARVIRATFILILLAFHLVHSEAVV